MRDGLRAMHARKTGALIRASAVSGAIMAGAEDDLVAAIDRYATDVGLAFQIVDDILDVEGDAGVARQDRRQGRRRRQANVSRALRPRSLARPAGDCLDARASSARIERHGLHRRLAGGNRGMGCDDGQELTRDQRHV